ncbi:MAG: SBBP repeat-containing protein [Chloroflexi bacterium]|nr:SBBP repeat-containing protein [Chloroflexota bacterium]
MKIKTFILPLLFVLWLPFLLSVTSPRFAAAALPPITPPTSSAMFIENVGQFAERARFQVQGSPGTLWLADDALWLTLLAPATDPPADASADLFPHNEFPYNTPGAEPSLGVHIKLSFVGANAAPELEPFGRRQTSVNYFTGNNPDQWHTDVPVWAGVRYVELYPGLDLEIGGEGGQLRPRLICHQNCSSALQQVRLQIEGVESFRLVEGQLTLDTPAGDFVFPPLLAVMNNSNTSSTFTLTPNLENNTVTFHVSAPHRPNFTFPVNPPGLVYSTFLGGNSYDNVRSIIVDELGHAYLAGATFSTNFPTTPGTARLSHYSGCL